jgi:hypothetical protein
MVRSSYLVRVYFVGSRFDIDRHESPLVPRLEDRTKHTLVNLISAAGKFFFAVTGLSFH